ASTAGFHGTPSVSGDNAVADGKSTATVTFPVTDANGNPVVNQTVTITTTNGASPSTTTVTTDENGNATVTVTSTTTGTTTVTATTPGGGSQSQDVNFIPGPPDASKSAFVMAPDVIKAGGSEVSALTLTLRDANNNPIEMNAGVSFAVSGLSGTSLTAVAARAGVYTSSLTGTKAGVVTVTPVVKGVSLTALARAVSLAADAGTAQIASGALTVTVDRAVADDQAKNSVRAVVTDANGNPVSGVHVTFSTVSPAHITVSSGVTDSLGVATASLASTVSGSTPVTATVNGSSQTVNVTFVADGATATLTSGSLTVKTTGAVADGTAQNSVSVRVTDARGNPVAGAEVAFSATNGARIASAGQTGSDGTLVQTLTSTKAGSSTVTATVNGASQTVSVAFVADTRTAKFSGTPVITGNGAPASGHDIIGVDYLVTDARGNPLAGQTVTITTNHGATPDTLTVTTDSNGVAHVEVTNTLAGITRVTAALNGQTQTADVNFVADGATATLTAANLKVITNNALANGVATNSVKALVTDAGGNPVPGVTVNFTADNGATLAGSGVTGADGTIIRTLTSTTAGTSVVTATVNGTSQTTGVVFKADSTTATLAAGSLVAVTTGAVANGTAQNSVKATVTDRYGNPVSGVTVNFAATNGATIAATGATGADGTVTQVLTSTKAGDSLVTATVNGANRAATVTFIADSSTAGLTATGAGLVTTLDNQAANGVAADTVKATVTDRNGNPVAGQTVSFSVTTGATLTTTQGTTDSSGVATAAITSLKAGAYTVTATVNGSSKTTTVTLIADSATAKFTGTPVITGDNAPADGLSKIDVAYTVTDANGNPLANQSVTVTTDHGAQPGSVTLTTDSSGVVTVSVTNTTAGATTVSATTAGQTQPATITFVPDTTTATITAGNLKIVTDNATADGLVTNSVKVIVTDAKGNLVPGVAVSFSATNGATMAASGTTGADGSVTQTLTSTKAGSSEVTATINGHSQKVTLTFVADSTTATLTAASGLKAGVNNAPANGTATNSVVATVTDSNGNPVPGVTVNFTVDNGATIAATGTTGADGTVTQTLTSKTAGNTLVTAGINGTTRSVTMMFTADSGTAGLDPAANPGSSLTATSGAKADNTATNTVTATVTDKNGNPVPGVAVSFTTDAGSTIVT
ncbi:TPA: beta strand repeat-containing protein, partial [Citrobacter amalonaticus]